MIIDIDLTLFLTMTGSACSSGKACLYTRGTVSYMVKESEMEKKQVTVYSNVG
jgi:hypothetical protein